MRTSNTPSAALARKGIFTFVSDGEGGGQVINSRRYPLGVKITTDTALTFSVPENQTVVGTLEAKVNGPDPVVWSIEGGADAARFTIDADTGALSFASAPNYESPNDDGTNNVYNLVVFATAAGKAVGIDVTVTVTNVNEAPTITSSATWTVASPSTTVGTMTSTDPDAGATKTWSISGGAQAALFDINSTTGALTFKAASTAGTKNVTVAVSDGTNTTTKALTITVT